MPLWQCLAQQILHWAKIPDQQSWAAWSRNSMEFTYMHAIWKVTNNVYETFWKTMMFQISGITLFLWWKSISSRQKSFLKQFKGKPCLGPFCHYPCSEKLIISWEQNMIILHFYKHNNKSKTKHLFLYSVTQLSCML